MVAKRKRSEPHSELDKFVHQSGVLLQREGKKIRTFLARKRVQQLKQAQSLLQEAENVKPSADGDTKAQDKQAKRLQKARAQVAKLEKEMKVLKALDLKAVVARAAEKTGLKSEHELKQQYAQQDEQEDDDDDDDDDEMNAEPSSDFEAEGSDGDDDGFDSEEYEKQQRGEHSEAENSDDEQQKDAEEKTIEAEAPPADAVDATEPKPIVNEAKQQSTPAPKKQQQQQEDKLELALVDAILAHKQMIPLLKAIEQRMAQFHREEQKKIRKKEKLALKKMRNEVLVGGRSAAAPTSLFLGSLSGRGDPLDDMDGGHTMAGNSYSMAGADDDIAEFLGEKKKKNRAGQMARRQKAIRQEEKLQREKDRENGIFRPFKPQKDNALSKYGPSERPKKSKKDAAEVQKKKKVISGKPDRSDKRRDAKPAAAATGAADKRRAPAAAAGPVRATMEAAHPSWIAKQALKAKQAVSIGGFSGKKITFDD